jgi:uncharacterized membrane protein
VRRAGAAALLAAPLVAWLAHAAGWSHAADALAVTAIVPVVMNFAFAALFAASWWRGDPLVTRFARLEGEPLTPARERYCRRLTLVWAIYLALLGVAGIGIAVYGDEGLRAWWAGIVNYLLIGALFVGELLYRSGSVRGVLDQMRNVRDSLRKSP